MSLLETIDPVLSICTWGKREGMRESIICKNTHKLSDYTGKCQLSRFTLPLRGYFKQCFSRRWHGRGIVLLLDYIYIVRRMQVLYRLDLTLQLPKQRYLFYGMLYYTILFDNCKANMFTGKPIYEDSNQKSSYLQGAEGLAGKNHTRTFLGWWKLSLTWLKCSLHGCRYLFKFIALHY